MKDLRDPLINRYRIKVDPSVWKLMGVEENEVSPRYNGAFVVPYLSINLRIIAASGGGWDHISVSVIDRCPTWDEMEHIAKLFFKEDEVAIQYHVPAKDYINTHPFVLHWWRPYNKLLKKLPMPPKNMV
jgi:hypothetical protein